MSEPVSILPRHQYGDFLRQLPDDWEQKEIKQIGAVVGGGTPSRDVPSFWQGSIPWLTPGEVSGRRTKWLHHTNEHISPSGLASSGANMLPVGSLLVTTRATLGACVINSVPMATNQGFKSVVFRRPEDASYYFHLFEKVKAELVRRASGTTFLEISGAEFGSIKVPSPSLDEKLNICRILDTLDTAIRETEAIIAKLETVKQGMLHDLLTRGIDANGELRPPQAEAPHIYKESPLGWVPGEWKVDPLGRIAIKIQDGTHFSPALGGEDNPYVTSKNIRFGYMDLDGVERIDKRQHNAIYRRCDPRFGDLLITKDGANTGNAALNICEEEISLLSSVAFARFDATVDAAGFYMHYILSPTGQQRIKDLMSGNAITRLTLAKIRGFLVPRPSCAEQTAILAALDEADARVAIERAGVDNLRAMKAGLMDDLLTGRVRVTPLLAEAAQQAGSA